MKILSNPTMKFAASFEDNKTLLSELCVMEVAIISPAKALPKTDPKFLVRVIVAETCVLNVNGITESNILLLGD